MTASYALSWNQKPHCPPWSDKGVRRGAAEESVKLRKEKSLMDVEMEDSLFTKTKKLCYPHEFKTLVGKEKAQGCYIIRFLLDFTPAKTASYTSLGKSWQ